MDSAPNASSTDPQSMVMTPVDVLAQAPPAVPDRVAPVAKRLLQTEGAHLIAFTFAPGQSMPEHQAAHPITVQCLSGQLTFTVGDQTVSLEPGVVIHVPARLRHEVECPPATSGPSVLLLTMLPGHATPHNAHER